MTDVVLVAMPFVHLERPNLAISLLKAVLDDAGHPTRACYGSLALAERIGLPDYMSLMSSSLKWTTLLVSEWLFSPAAFPEHEGDLEELVGLIPASPEERRHLRRLLAGARAEIPGFLDGMVEEVLALRPRVVGCTSTFQQHVASLALLRRIREAAPQVVTMMGGANCETVMGRATHRNFPWVDYVVSGEADGLIVPLVRGAMEHGRALEEVPRGVLAPLHRERGYPDERARATFDALDTLPYPAFDDYFARHARSPLARAIDPGLILETSRGCWWGAKHHCTFCGLNAGGMGYRRKSPARALAEFESMADRWGTHRIQLVDDILDARYVDTVMPALRDSGRPWNIFYEIKSNLKREHLETLAAAGVRSLQPGIESLHTKLLALMNKGAKSWQQVQVLKFARQFGIWLHWNMLLNFPGEEDAWHGETAAMVPLLAHLQPPYGVVPIRFDRFSPYFEQRDDLGLDLVPHDLMPFIYPVPEEERFDLCYHFRQRALPPDWSEQEGLAALVAALSAWRRAFRAHHEPMLTAEDDGEAVHVTDLRPCAVRERHELRGVEREVHQACDEATGWNGLAQRVQAPEAEVRAALDRLVRDRLLLAVDDRWLSLALTPEAPRIPYRPAFPGGELHPERLPEADYQLALRLLGG